MSIRDGPSQSKNDQEFIIRSLRGGRRVDGRKLGEMRLLRMVFARAEGQASAEIQLGRTRVLAVVTGEVGASKKRFSVLCVRVSLFCNCDCASLGTSCACRPYDGIIGRA